MRLLTIPVLGALLAVTACGAEADPVGNPPPGTTDGTIAATPSTTAPPSPTPTPSSLPPGTLPSEPETPRPDELRYDPDVARAELEAARATWATQGWPSYRFSYTPLCFCPREEIRVEVIDGRVVNSTGESGDSPVAGLSIEDWFDEIDAAIGTAADIRVTYDDWGYPTELYVDVSEQMVDEEFGFEFVGFAHVPDAIRDIMTDEYGCGFGFWVATPDQTAAFMVGIDDITDFETGPAPGSYELAELSGNVRFGTDLMANWCDDVIEEGEPEADVTATWAVVGGNLELTIVDNRTATAILTDVVAKTPDGDEYRLGDATITNDMWGFFAG